MDNTLRVVIDVSNSTTIYNSSDILVRARSEISRFYGISVGSAVNCKCTVGSDSSKEFEAYITWYMGQAFIYTEETQGDKLKSVMYMIVPNKESSGRTVITETYTKDNIKFSKVVFIGVLKGYKDLENLEIVYNISNSYVAKNICQMLSIQGSLIK